MDRLCDQVVAEMRANESTDQMIGDLREIADESDDLRKAAEKERDELRAELSRLRERGRFGSHVLVDYLTDHHRDTWRANESAAAFAVRLLTSAGETIASMQGEIDRTKAERTSAERERDATRAELRSAGQSCDAFFLRADLAERARDGYKARAEAAEGKVKHAAADVVAMAEALALSATVAKLNAALDSIGTIDPGSPLVADALDRATHWISKAGERTGRMLEELKAKRAAETPETPEGDR